MSIPKKIPRSELKEIINSNSSFYLGRISFEKRSTAAFNDLKTETNLPQIKKHFFYSVEESSEAKKNRIALKLDPTESTPLDTRHPLNTHMRIKDVLISIFKDSTFKKLFIDITSFRREELLMVLRVLYELRNTHTNDVEFLYTAASNMGEWLSKQVYGLRSIIGYGGDIDARSTTHLIILLGFELHRALSIIDSYEPEYISLGRATSNESINDELYKRNIEVCENINRTYSNIISEFEFSAISASSVANQLSSVTSSFPNMNTVVAPLHTKLSTLGVGILAIRNPNIQVCYADVDSYNRKAYSTPADYVFMLEASELFEFVSGN